MCLFLRYSSVLLVGDVLVVVRFEAKRIERQIDVGVAGVVVVAVLVYVPSFGLSAVVE